MLTHSKTAAWYHVVAVYKPVTNAAVAGIILLAFARSDDKSGMLLVKGKSHMAHIACTSQQLTRPAPNTEPGNAVVVWAAWYTTRLLVKIMAKGVVCSFLLRLLLIKRLLVELMAQGVVCAFL